jgi:hypothetical protein
MEYARKIPDALLKEDKDPVKSTWYMPSDKVSHYKLP